LDLPGWQAVYEKLGGENFEIISVAQDTGGEAAAGEFYDAADATYTTLIDVHHTVSSLYNMTNVPTGVWIDEAGMIVRPNEVAYSENVEFGTIKVNGEAYVSALADWVEHGGESRFALSPTEVVLRVRPRSGDAAAADATFKLGAYFHEQGDLERANALWHQAQELQPESWNYHRQDWSFRSRDEASQNWRQKFEALGDEPYYAPLALEDAPP